MPLDAGMEWEKEIKQEADGQFWRDLICADARLYLGICIYLKECQKNYKLLIHSPFNVVFIVTWHFSHRY
jgi:hypothetical protein